jgi:hypothetical protein
MLYRIDAAPKVAVIVQPKSFAIKLLSNADIILYRALVGMRESRFKCLVD